MSIDMIQIFSMNTFYTAIKNANEDLFLTYKTSPGDLSLCCFCSGWKNLDAWAHLHHRKKEVLLLHPSWLHGSGHPNAVHDPVRIPFRPQGWWTIWNLGDPRASSRWDCVIRRGMCRWSRQWWGRDWGHVARYSL